MCLYQVNRNFKDTTGNYNIQYYKDTICTIGEIKNNKISVNFGGRYEDNYRSRSEYIDLKYFTNHIGDDNKTVKSYFDIIPKQMTESEERMNEEKMNEEAEKERLNRMEDQEAQENYSNGRGGGRRTKRSKKQYRKKQSKKSKRLLKRN
jgi:hypothetical protein